MEETYSDFSAFVGKYSNDTYESTMSSTSREYGKALKALREREVFELQLNQSKHSFEAFSAYLDWEQSSAPKISESSIGSNFVRTNSGHILAATINLGGLRILRGKIF